MKFVFIKDLVAPSLPYHHSQVFHVWGSTAYFIEFLHYSLFDSANVFIKSCILYYLLLSKQTSSVHVGSKTYYVRMMFPLTAIPTLCRALCALTPPLLMWLSGVNHWCFCTPTLIFSLSSRGASVTDWL